MKVLCISAKAQHGKDTAAGIIKEYLESKGKRVLIIHYADLVKFVCTKFFNCDGQKDEKGRTLLQYGGTGWTEHIDRDGSCFEVSEIKLTGNNSYFKYNKHL